MYSARIHEHRYKDKHLKRRLAFPWTKRYIGHILKAISAILLLRQVFVFYTYYDRTHHEKAQVLTPVMNLEKAIYDIFWNGGNELRNCAHCAFWEKIVFIAPIHYKGIPAYKNLMLYTRAHGLQCEIITSDKRSQSQRHRLPLLISQKQVPYSNFAAVFNHVPSTFYFTFRKVNVWLFEHTNNHINSTRTSGYIHSQTQESYREKIEKNWEFRPEPRDKTGAVCRQASHDHSIRSTWEKDNI